VNILWTENVTTNSYSHDAIVSPVLTFNFVWNSLLFDCHSA